MLVALAEGITSFGLNELGSRAEASDKLVIDSVLNKDTRAGCADLTHIPAIVKRISSGTPTKATA